MIQIHDTIISLDLLEEYFCCDLSACKGICCVEGDSGAPVEAAEIAALEVVLPIVWDDLSPQAQKIIEQQGVVYKDPEDEWVTSIVNGKRLCIHLLRRKRQLFLRDRKSISRRQNGFLQTGFLSFISGARSKIQGISCRELSSLECLQTGDCLGQKRKSQSLSISERAVDTQIRTRMVRLSISSR